MAKELPKELVDKLLALDRATVAGLPSGIDGNKLTLPASIPVPEMLQGLQRSVEDAQQDRSRPRTVNSLPLSIPSPGGGFGAFPDVVPQLPREIPAPRAMALPPPGTLPGLAPLPGQTRTDSHEQPLGLPKSIPSPALTLPSGERAEVARVHPAAVDAWAAIRWRIP